MKHRQPKKARGGRGRSIMETGILHARTANRRISQRAQQEREKATKKALRAAGPNVAAVANIPRDENIPILSEPVMTGESGKPLAFSDSQGRW